MTRTLTKLMATTAVAALLAGCLPPDADETADAATDVAPAAMVDANGADADNSGDAAESGGGASIAAATPGDDDEAGPPTIEDARAFVDRVEAELEEYSEYAARIYWVNSNFITYDTDWLATRVGAEGTVMGVRFANEAKAFNDLDLSGDPTLARALDFIKQGLTIPAPEIEGAAQELAEISTRLGSNYSTGEIDLADSAFSAEQLEATLRELRGDGADVDMTSVVSQSETESLMRNLRDPALLADVWTRWRDVPRGVPEDASDGPGMRADYERMVEIANEGARELGFADVGELWLSGYDMEPAEMAAEVDRLWSQVKPLYDELHCYVRAELNEEYGDDVVPLDQPIRADLFGNMWAQQWANIYDLVAPEGSDIGFDLTEILEEQGYTPLQIVETGDAFFQSLGFEPMPDTFWERSLITKPRDRDVVCHASAWDLSATDYRIKMCTEVNADDFQTVHHELGHNFYQRAYRDQPVLFRTGAHDGFHEAIGDFVGLSLTPNYLVQIGLLTEDQIPPASADTGLLMSQALDKIAFLPFGLLMDKWRWGVFSGEIQPSEYNTAWWEMREHYQGVRAPTDRPVDAFDPGGKYHIPNNVPYLRYFLSFVMQFQFHEAACEQAGWEGPLHRCSIYGNEEVGARFAQMLEAGASQPWPDTLELFTGTRQMDGSAIIAYFEPLIGYLEEQNEGRSCGWTPPED